MGGPAGVADADLTGRGRDLKDLLQSFDDLSFLFAGLQALCINNGQAGAIVSAIFQTAQTFQKDRGGLLFSDISYNSTHRFFGIGLFA